MASADHRDTFLPCRINALFTQYKSSAHIASPVNQNINSTSLLDIATFRYSLMIQELGQYISQAASQQNQASFPSHLPADMESRMHFQRLNQTYSHIVESINSSTQSLLENCSKRRKRLGSSFPLRQRSLVFLRPCAATEAHAEHPAETQAHARTSFQGRVEPSHGLVRLPW